MFASIKRNLAEIPLKIARHSSYRYCNYLRKQGVAVGRGTHIDSETAWIDCSRPSLVTIGENCYINRNFTLFTHDYVSKVFIFSGREYVNSSGKVTIGNNVSFGHDVTVLKGVTIGDNCFIGACSLVNKDIPANSIAVGSPCRVVMSLDEYYEKRVARCEDEAFEYARSIVSRFGRQPVVEDFWEEFPLFVDGDKVEDYPSLPIKSQLGPSYERYVKTHKARYSGFRDFLKAAGTLKD